MHGGGNNEILVTHCGFEIISSQKKKKKTKKKKKPSNVEDNSVIGLLYFSGYNTEFYHISPAIILGFPFLE